MNINQSLKKNKQKTIKKINPMKHPQITNMIAVTKQ